MLGKTNPNWPLPNISWASAVTDRPQFAWFILLPVTWREWQNTDLFDFNSLKNNMKHILQFSLLAIECLTKCWYRHSSSRTTEDQHVELATFVKLY
jgi:hypothetical protein